MMQSQRKKSFLNNALTYGMVIAAYLVMQILLSGGHISSALRGQLVPITVYIVMAVSLNLTVGVLGELSLGHAGFMSVGAFSGVIISFLLAGTALAPGLKLTIGMAGGAIMAGIFGFLIGIPVLRLHGDYLAIVTLAFGEIIKNVINAFYIGFDATGLKISMTSSNALKLGEGGKVILNGPMGAIGIQRLATFTAGFILILITLFIVLNLVNSRSGRAIMAVRDNKIAAESVGVSVWKYRMMAFVTSATLAGAAGALYALNFSTVVARTFDFNLSILVLVFVVLGGMGNIRGSIIAATVLTVLPEVLRAFDDVRMLVYAIILIIVMLTTNNPIIKQWKGKMTRLFKREAPVATELSESEVSHD